jgi:hypothetical protein
MLKIFWLRSGSYSVHALSLLSAPKKADYENETLPGQEVVTASAPGLTEQHERSTRNAIQCANDMATTRNLKLVSVIYFPYCTAIAL